MARLAFKQCDLERALRAGAATGIAVVVRIERETGDLIVAPAEAVLPPRPAAAGSDGDFWDRFDEG